MNFTLRQLEILQKCSETLHFSRAAQQLCMTPAAVCKQISKLEEQLGFKLFEVIGKKVQLTAQCRNLLPNVNNITNEVANLKSVINDKISLQTKPIKISLGPGLESIIFKNIHDFKTIYPDIIFEIAIHHDRQSQLQDLLDDKINPILFM